MESKTYKERAGVVGQHTERIRRPAKNAIDFSLSIDIQNMSWVNSAEMLIDIHLMALPHF